jgi:hypothetical protein
MCAVWLSWQHCDAAKALVDNLRSACSQADIAAVLKGAAAQAVAAGVSPADEQAMAADVLQTALRAEPALIGQVRSGVLAPGIKQRCGRRTLHWLCCWVQVAHLQFAEESLHRQTPREMSRTYMME